MMNAIRMVWVISRHYNTDERMVPLMELIAGDIAEKVQPECFIGYTYLVLVRVLSTTLASAACGLYMPVDFGLNY